MKTRRTSWRYACIAIVAAAFAALLWHPSFAFARGNGMDPSIDADVQPNNVVCKPIRVQTDPSSVTGGNSFELTVTERSISESDRTVSISTDQQDAFSDLPASVVVPAGSSSASVTVQTCTVSSSVNAAITCNDQVNNDTTYLAVAAAQ